LLNRVENFRSGIARLGNRARGRAEHSAGRRTVVGRLAQILSALVLGWVLAVSLQQVLVLLLALGTSGLAGSGLAHSLAGIVLRDRVYAGVALQIFGNIEVAGIALAGPSGEAAHHLWPLIFQAPTPATDAPWAGVVFGSGSSLAGVTLARLLADGLTIATGCVLVASGVWGLRARPGHWALWRWSLGSVVQAYGLAMLLVLRLGPEQLEALGLAQVATKVMALARADYDAFLAGAAPGLGLAIKVLVGICAYALAGLVLRRLRHRRTGVRIAAAAPPVLGKWSGRLAFLNPVAPALVALPLALLLLQVGARGGAAYQPPPESARPQRLAPAAIVAPEQLASDVAYFAPASAPAKPSRVEVSGGAFQYRYTVNGRETVLRGVGYNIPPREESVVERAARLDRDFGLMEAAGVNTILGWDQGQFDELLLDIAERHHLGVILPFPLPEKADYGDLAQRAALRAEILTWVGRYRDHPALRMWGIGNEVMHLERNPASPRLRDFSSALVEIADAVHAADPDHPVIYREAEDIYLPMLAEALAARPAQRPWFVYGMNIFTYRLATILRGWPERGYDLPLVISEFGVPGMRRADRPGGYLKMWRMLAQQPMILGGFAYVWYSNGPEPLDATFGLVDGNCVPTDGTLDTLSAAFLAATSGAQ
jgi:hypothetical protein